MTDQPAPDFSLPGTHGADFTVSGKRGTKIVLYFYPRDNTPGCTTEAQQFRDLHGEFAACGCEIYGISRDSLKSHGSFKEKLGLPFELLSDQDEVACNAYGVIKMKSMYGRKVRGIERSTFVVDPAGVLRGEWRGIKVPGHAQQVLDFVRALDA